nr:hypothetical protein [uncultured Desulfuromonas sp.]
MRHLGALLVLFIVLVFSAPAQANWSGWQEYTTITTQEKPFITLEVRTFYSSSFPPRVQWRATNRSEQAVYCSEIGRQVYILTSGRKVIKPPKGCRTMAPGETTVFANEIIGNKGQQIAKISMDMFSFDLEQGKRNRQQVPL